MYQQQARLTPYSNTKRIVYGSMWAFWTVVFAVLAVIGLSGVGIFAGLVCAVLAFFSGRYDYRIWTWKAKRLWFLFII